MNSFVKTFAEEKSNHRTMVGYTPSYFCTGGNFVYECFISWPLLEIIKIVNL